MLYVRHKMTKWENEEETASLLCRRNTRKIKIKIKLYETIMTRCSTMVSLTSINRFPLKYVVNFNVARKEMI